jgi:hypothetical protein
VTTTLTTTDAYEQVSEAYASHLAHLNARDISALPGDYERNATVEFVGVNPGLVGQYSGAMNIQILWGSFTGKLVDFSLSNEYQSIEVKNSSLSIVNSTFDFEGNDTVIGLVKGSVIAQDVYVHSDGGWLIDREVWNFTQFNMPPLG